MNDVEHVVAVSVGGEIRAVRPLVVDDEPGEWDTVVVIRCGVRSEAGDRCRRPLVELVHDSQSGWCVAMKMRKGDRFLNGDKDTVTLLDCPTHGAAYQLPNMLGGLLELIQADDAEFQNARRSGSVVDVYARE